MLNFSNHIYSIKHEAKIFPCQIKYGGRLSAIFSLVRACVWLAARGRAGGRPVRALPPTSHPSATGSVTMVTTPYRGSPASSPSPFPFSFPFL